MNPNKITKKNLPTTTSDLLDRHGVMTQIRTKDVCFSSRQRISGESYNYTIPLVETIHNIVGLKLLGSNMKPSYFNINDNKLTQIM